MPQPLIILGTGGNAFDVLDIVGAINRLTPTWEVVGYLDDGRSAGTEYLGCPVLGGLALAANHAGAMFISTIRNERTHRLAPDILRRTGLHPDRFATLVHPAAGVSAFARLGRGVYVNFGASVAGDVTLADHVSLGPNSTVGHNTEVGAHSIIAPGAILSGKVQVGECCYVGAGAVVRQGIRIGDEALIGMGAVVVRDVPVGSVVVGNPANPLVRRIAN